MARGAKPIIVEFDSVLRAFKLPSFEDSVNMDQSDVYGYALRQAAEEGLEGEEAEQFAMQAESDLEAWYHDAYMASIEETVESAFEKVGLVAELDKKDYKWRLSPEKSWDDTAKQIVEVINGVGYFHFSTLREFLDSGPYTAREAVEHHFGYAKDYSEVYGDRSPARQFESSFESRARNLG